MSYFERIVSIIKEKKPTKDELVSLKHQLARELKAKTIPTDIEIFMNLSASDVKSVKPYLFTKPVRTISGVVPIAIMTAPYNCPHGKCTFCPGGPGSYYGDVPQSYTGKEPATLRGIRNKYNAYLQVMNRLEQFVVLGNIPQKCEIIVMGGTFISYPKQYKDGFIMDTFQAMNDFSYLFFEDGEFNLIKFKEFFELPGEVGSSDRTDRLHAKMLKLKESRKKSLEDLKSYNDLDSFVKCIGLTIETKPDWGFLEHGNDMLNYGCTRVELGVQSVYDEPLHLTHRGHNLADSIRSITELRDLGFKLNFHYMPGLPGVSKEKDVLGLKTLFSDSRFRPDMLKVYPCMVMPGTPLEVQWKKGLFKPLTTSESAEMIAEFKRDVPPYCRIMRVQRDIPTFQTTAGVDKTNLRQYIDVIVKERGIVCKCIRCREVGKSVGKLAEPTLQVMSYEASSGIEYFISLETSGYLFGFCRLRFPSQSLRSEITPTSALIRELHVYGETALLSSVGNTQHKGYGRILLSKAEEIAVSNGKTKMVVISGVGVRGYYRKFGYSLEGPYMVKKL